MQISTKQQEIDGILSELAGIKSLFQRVASLIPSFNIADPKLLPYGLKPHTRSISWIAEQVITQQAKFNAKLLLIDDVNIDVPDTSLHDCVVHSKGIEYYVNVKVHNADGKKNKNDISAVAKLFMQYTSNPSYRLMYVCFPVTFNNTLISIGGNAHVFSPQFLPVYVNPNNDKIQAYYEHHPEIRSRQEFLDLLKAKSKSIVL